MEQEEKIVENFADDKRYKKRRKSVEKSCKKYKESPDATVYSSPSGNYELRVTQLQTGEGYWNYTKGVVIDTRTKEEVFTVLRNYSSFLYRFIEHQNGNEYLLCGEDYQGYVCLNLTEKKKHVFFPESGFKGWGFCWVDIKEYDKDYDDNIRVEGCVWGGPFDIVEYDFTTPDKVPYKYLNSWPADPEEDWDDDDPSDEDWDDE